MFVTHLLPNYNKYRKFNKILPKAATLSLAAMISRQGDTSIAKNSDTDLQVVTRDQLQLVFN